MKRLLMMVLGAVVLAACGSSAQLKTVQNNRTVQQTEVKVQQQVRKCLPTSNGTPDPLLLRRSAERAKFASCAGVVKDAKALSGCVVKVLLGGLPTTARLEKGLSACLEQAA